MAKKVVIIGGGISGMTAGIHALNAGFDVEIYESHTAIGGLCSGWKRNDHLIAGAIHWMMGTKNDSDLHEIWKDTGAIDENTEIFYHDTIAACKDGDVYRYLYADITKLEEEFLNISPEDEECIKELVRAINVQQKLPIPAAKPMDLMEDMEKAITFARYIKAEKKVPLSGISIADFVERFQSPIIRDLLYSIVPNTTISAQTLLMWLAAHSNGDAGFPMDGFGAMTVRMKNRLEVLGAKIFLKSKVKKIITINGVATGIELENGKQIDADYVISTISPDMLLNGLLENQYCDFYFEKRFKAPHAFPTLALTLISLVIDFDMAAFPHTLYFEPHDPIFINNTEIKKLKINHYRSFPAFCKNGKTLTEVVLHGSEFEYWRNLKASSLQTYKAKKEQLATQIIKEIGIIYPETKGKIELLDVATPLTFHRYTGSFGGSFMPFCAMPHTGRENHNGKIDGVENLYLAGQWVFPDGGLPMAAVAGKFAVQRICYQENSNINTIR